MGTTPTTIYKYISEGRLQAYNVGQRLTRVTTASLERFIAQAQKSA
jgi:excisionase family DNA binding protein